MIIVLAGPTGSGKSDLAISLAKRLGGAIINGDAFQVYKELDIATAKPTLEMRMEVPHFLFDFVPLTDAYSVYEYQNDLRSAIATLSASNTPIIIAGGTGLYIRAGLYDYEFPPEAEVDMSAYEKLSDEEAYAELKRLDPEASASIHPHNRLRVMRALRVILATGKKKSEIIAKQEHKPIYDDVHFFGLSAERASLYERVDARVDRMVKDGLVEENRRLIDKYGRDRMAFRAIGVKEFFPYFDGEKSLDECIAEVKKATRNYVKRQMTFFLHQFDIEWIKGEEDVLEAISHE